MKTPAFDQLSETAGMDISAESASMMLTRYTFAAELAKGRRTLELACASGPGLRLISRNAALTVGADINWAMLARAQDHYKGTYPLAQTSAEQLPFADGSFDLVIFMEASYYVHVDVALPEIDRILAPGGRILFVNANPQRPDFIRSPHSIHYHSAAEFVKLLDDLGYDASAFAAFPCRDEEHGGGLKPAVLQLARQTLEAFGLVPKTLKGRARLKRLLGQKLRPVPGEIDTQFAVRQELHPVTDANVGDFKVIYVSAERRPSRTR